MATLLKNLWDGSDYKIDLNVGNEILNEIRNFNALKH